MGPVGAECIKQARCGNLCTKGLLGFWQRLRRAAAHLQTTSGQDDWWSPASFNCCLGSQPQSSSTLKSRRRAVALPHSAAAAVGELTPRAASQPRPPAQLAVYNCSSCLLLHGCLARLLLLHVPPNLALQLVQARHRHEGVHRKQVVVHLRVTVAHRQSW